MWQSGFALKTGKREVPGSIPGHACQPSHSEFSRGFLRNSCKYGQGSLRSIPMEDTLPLSPVPTWGQLTLFPQPQLTLHLIILFYKVIINHISKRQFMVLLCCNKFIIRVAIFNITINNCYIDTFYNIKLNRGKVKTLFTPLYHMFLSSFFF